MSSLAKLDVPQGAIAIHWFGQSSFAFKDAAGVVVQVDPYFPHTRPSADFIHSAPPLDESSLKTDYVLLTHDHGDHTCPESLLRIHGAFPTARFVGPQESIARLRTLGIPDTLLSTVAAGDTHALGTIKVHVVWAKPPAGTPDEGIPAPDVEHLGFVIDFGSIRVYISGDPINTLSRHAELLAPIAAHRPQIGLLTTHPTEGEFPYFAGSVEMAVKLNLRTAVPAHYDCFVKRTYDPQIWAAGLPAEGPTPLIIPYNHSVIYHG